MREQEVHFGHRIGWLRAMVLGANDGIISIAALLLGMAAADATRSTLLTAGMAGLVAGAVSMALGEYVSVASQRDSEHSDIAKETWELKHQAEMELEELTAIYQARGLTEPLAREVAVQLTEHDALATHLRDELGISADELARPMQAAGSSAVAFMIGGVIPMVAASLASISLRIGLILSVTVVALIALGFIGAKAGGAKPGRPIVRVLIGGAAAMGFTMLVGKVFGAAIA
ncbi:MAG: VIT family protein [Actinomycetota bacterium]|nr:VIT family protein [Actinomycetota bacterium]